jgi:ribonuclease Z
MLNFTFLGTSSGVPTRQRNVTGLAVPPVGGRDWFLIDAGEGTQHQLQKTGHSLRSLQAVCITPVHGDHCYGLPGLLASAGMAGRTAPLTLVAPLPVWTWLSSRASTDLHLPSDIHHVDSALQPAVWQSPGVRITAHALHHRVACHAFVEVRKTRRVWTRRPAADRSCRWGLA